jgi:hypothetical protein
MSTSTTFGPRTQRKRPPLSSLLGRVRTLAVVPMLRTRIASSGLPCDLLVVGAYPNGMRWDLRRGDPAARAEILANIEAVPLPDTDPVHGPDGPLTEIWPAAG